jgi:hypothetical protein
MINNTNNENAPEFSIKRTGKQKATKRISCPNRDTFNGRKANLGMAYGKSVHGVISCAVPGELYKQIVMVAKQEKINLSDFVRRGVMREVGATLLCRSLNLNPDVYGVAAQIKPAKPAKQVKTKEPVDRATKVEARKAIRDLRKALKRLAN